MSTLGRPPIKRQSFSSSGSPALFRPVLDTGTKLEHQRSTQSEIDRDQHYIHRKYDPNQIPLRVLSEKHKENRNKCDDQSYIETIAKIAGPKVESWLDLEILTADLTFFVHDSKLPEVISSVREHFALSALRTTAT